MNMRCAFSKLAGALCVGGILLANTVAGEVLHIDLSQPPPPLIKGHLGMGAARSPDGQTLDADSVCLYLNGKPWMPVSGEFHFSRYPCTEWRDQLLKMKAGGLEIVATYVFWIHHEEHQGEWDWTGQRSLRDFVRTSREVGLKVIVRMGPRAHGEVRNGGFPDWVQARERSQRRNQDPEFMALTEKLYRQIAQQLDGQLWKDGGPVIGIQLDNECPDVPYLFALKELARKCGIDVPFYTITGWNGVKVPEEGLLPLFGGYPDGFWTDKKDKFKTYYFFSPERNVGDMGAIGPVVKTKQKELSQRLVRFPYACCEIGGGMASSYDRRVAIAPDDCAALALVKLGCGNNMPGYYMYQGGINPEGKYSYLNESKAVGEPNDMPLKDYDFNAPLGACGQLHEQYHLLREQHLLLKDWGATLALMPARFPWKKPVELSDTNMVRWSVRSDGERAFLFFNNYQRFGVLPPKENVQFSLKMKNGTQLLPGSPVTIPTGAYGVWPVNMDCAGVTLTYATAQPLCRLDEAGEHWFFFKAINGIAPEFVLGGRPLPERMDKIKSGTGVAFTRLAPDQSKVHFVVLTPEQAQQLCKISLAGREHAVLSASALLLDANQNLRLETLGAESPTLAFLPAVKAVAIDGAPAAMIQDGASQCFTASNPTAPCVAIAAQLLRPANINGDNHLDAIQEESWKHAAVWRLPIPAELAQQSHLLRINYRGDVARLYAGGKLVCDNFYNGLPFDVALWRIPADQWASIEIHVLPPRADRSHVGAGTSTEANLVNITALLRRQWNIEVK